MDIFTLPETYFSLLSLTAMEIVLGIDNIVFIAIISGKLPKSQQKKARTLGLVLALVFRLLLLSTIAWLATLTEPLFSILSSEISARDLILMIGGIFLIYKSTQEIYHKFENTKGEKISIKSVAFKSVVMQIIMIDIIFSVDSIITAIGLAQHVSVMVIAVIIALIVMLIFAGKISDFIEKHPSLKILALAFLLMIGTLLVADSFDFHVPKGYVYFAMAFALAIEIINISYRNKKRSLD